MTAQEAKNVIVDHVIPNYYENSLFGSYAIDALNMAIFGLEKLNNSNQEVKKSNVGDVVSRRFMELLAEYHDPEICPYKEYKGKPYFSIKYIEDGQEYVGYGTYSPKVLSQYLRKYFMPSAQSEVVRCKDCKHRYIKDLVWDCPFGLSGGENFFCGYGSLERAERRTDERSD